MGAGIGPPAGKIASAVDSGAGRTGHVAAGAGRGGGREGDTRPDDASRGAGGVAADEEVAVGQVGAAEVVNWIFSGTKA